MTLVFENGRQTITNALGQIVFDTDVRNFIAAAFVSDTINLPGYSYAVGGSGANEADIYRTVASGLPAECDVAVGMLRYDAGPWTVANGTHLSHFQCGGLTNSLTYYQWRFVRGVRALTFIAGGGLLRLHERTLLCPATNGTGLTQTYTIPAQTMHFRIFVGNFT